MKNSTKALMVGAAISGLFVGTAPSLHASTGSATATAGQAAYTVSFEQTKDKHSCKGKNSCKGQGADGKNSCKGKGSCATDGSKPPSAV
jgi:hypothetical protein